MNNEKCEIGLIGLAVMGQNLVLNMERNGFSVAVYNRTAETTEEFLRGSAAGKRIRGTHSIEEFVRALARPRQIALMVKAGPPVDAVLEDLRPHLEPGDLIMEGGNSFFADTERRARDLAADGIQYLGVGISGGEYGALWGPSIMPGGPREGYDRVEGVLAAIAAKVDGDPCVTYVGPGGAGHFVKMVHNGIEYGDMQLIAEAYDLLHRALGLSSRELHKVFSAWNRGDLSSYLIEITGEIFNVMDPETEQPLAELILDEAEQKGTGRWTTQCALELGVPTPTINAAVEARLLSAGKEERKYASKRLVGSNFRFEGNTEDFVDAIGDALYASKICSYAQGFALLKAASREYEYHLNPAELARIWRGGCIIRAKFLDDVRDAYMGDPEVVNLLLVPFFRDAVATLQENWRDVVATATRLGIPTPAMNTSLAYYDAYRSERLPANLTQAQRDYFGAHTYRRVDREGTFHTDWQQEAKGRD